MENSLINKIEISTDQIFRSSTFKKHLVVSSNIIPQVQFLISRTDELRTVLKEIDDILKRIKEESLKNFF